MPEDEFSQASQGQSMIVVGELPISEVRESIERLLNSPEEGMHVYEREYYRLKAEIKSDQDFTELTTKFPEEDPAQEFLRRAHMKANKSNILSDEELDKLKIESPELYARVKLAYIDFLADKTGLK